MAKKKRPKSASAPKTTSEPASVRKAVKQLRDYYQLGQEMLAADAKNPNRGVYSKGVTKEFAERIGTGRDYVDKARQFASRYTEDQLDELCSLRRPDGMPLGRRHLIALLSVKDKRQRNRLQRMAAEEGWGTRRLGEEIVGLQGSQSSGGRRPRGPESVAGALAQIAKMSERWGRWVQGFERGEVKLETLPKTVRARLTAVTAEIEKLEHAVRRHLKST